MRSFFLILALVALSTGPRRVLSQRLSSGPCQSINPMPAFDLSLMVGEWFEVERSFYIVESALRCTRVNFTLSEDKNRLLVQVIYKLPWRGELSSAQYEADVQQDTGGVLEMLLSESPPTLARLAPGSGTYTVLDIDPDDYALIYSCTSFRFFHADFVWILGRKNDISANMRTRVYAVLDRLNIPRERLLLTKQDC